jgi:hypothetical protein
VSSVQVQDICQIKCQTLFSLIFASTYQTRHLFRTQFHQLRRETKGKRANQGHIFNIFGRQLQIDARNILENSGQQNPSAVRAEQKSGGITAQTTGRGRPSSYAYKPAASAQNRHFQTSQQVIRRLKRELRQCSASRRANCE